MRLLSGRAVLPGGAEVRFRSGLSRLGKPGGSWQRWLPLISAVVVTLLGTRIVLKGLMAYVA
jgi:hypothetical protein